MVGSLRAALDIGSNTIRLLVARYEDGSVSPIRDDSEFVRLGLGVDKTGELNPDRERAAVQAIQHLAAVARELGAERLLAIATSAVRDARNGQAFVERVREETGVEVRIISGEEEAKLTFLGASMGISLARGAIVVDLGGGSAEIIAADENGMRWAQSVPLGSGRLTEQFIHQDPPGAEGIGQLRRHVDALLEHLPHTDLRRAILTGGTASQIGPLAGKPTPKPLRGGVPGSGKTVSSSGKTGKRNTPLHMKPEEVDRALAVLCSDPAQEIVRRFDVKPERAAVLPAGVAALSEIIHFYRVDEVLITRYGIREGLIEAGQRGCGGS